MSVTDEQTEGDNDTTPDNVPDTPDSQEHVMNEWGKTPSVGTSQEEKEMLC